MAQAPINYESCLLQAQNGSLSPDCLNDWSIMRQIVNNHLNTIFAERLYEISNNLIEEFQRLYRLWQTNRTFFAVQVVGWYNTPD